MKGRRAKRKVVYVDPDSDDDSEGEVKPKASNGRRPRKSLKEDSEDEYMFDEADDAAMGKYNPDVNTAPTDNSSCCSGRFRGQQVLSLQISFSSQKNRQGQS